MNKLKIKKGFTLVELIIVITILVILATIAFVSFQNYTKDARDSNRLMSIKNIQNGLEGFQIKTGIYPEPENSINILAGTSTITKQGYFGESQSDIINIDKLPLDPLDGTKYIYSINNNKNKYQLLSYLEANSQLSFINETYADDLSKRNIKSFGNNLGIILNQDKTNITGTGFDLLANSGSIFKFITPSYSINTSGYNILSIYAILNKNLSNLDDSLLGYWDMETTTLSGSLTILKDLSKYGNHGTIAGLGKYINFVKGKEGNAIEYNEKSPIICTGTSLGISIKPNNLGLKNITNGNITINMLLKLSYQNPVGIFHLVTQYGFPGCGSAGIGGCWNISSQNSNISINKPPLIGKDFINYTYVFDKSLLTQKQYINGILYKTGIIANEDYGTVSEFNIGHYSYGCTDASIGIFDDTRIYNRALSDEEINFLYNTFN